MTDLPPGWVSATLGEVTELWDHLREPINSTEREKRRGAYPYFGANGQAGTIDGYKYDGDFVLLAEDGGYFDDPGRGVAYCASGKFWVNNHAHVLKPRGGMSTLFWMRLLNSLAWLPHVSGTTRLKLTQGAMNKVEVPLPPLNEQRRIVAKLEVLLARSRRTKEALSAVPALLERFRQSVLASAFRGDLTREWREKNPNVEPASRLLERNRVERRRRWEAAELEKLRAKGKVPKDEKWKERYEEPLPCDALPPVEVPPSWSWSTLDALTFVKGGLALGKKRERGEVLHVRPYLRVANVQRGRLDLAEVKTVSVNADEARDLELRAGDVLFNEGGDRDKLGRGWVWSGEVPGCIHQNHVFRGRPVIAELQPKLLSWYGNTFGQRYFVDEGKQTTNLASVSMTKLKQLPVSVIPVEEQAALVARVEELFTDIAAIEAGFSEASTRLPLLEQSVLAKAFRGELVPQDAADEPASTLLDRIRAERELPAKEEPTSRHRRRRESKVA